MIARGAIVKALKAAVKSLNAQLPAEQRLSDGEDAIIFGSSSGLDSLGFLNLVLCIESELEAAFSSAPSIAETIMSGSDQEPPKTIGALADFILDLFQDEANGASKE
ncbi:MAG: hypothetical protein V3W41_01495 [Planctomycetota bacterium]